MIGKLFIYLLESKNHDFFGVFIWREEMSAPLKPPQNSEMSAVCFLLLPKNGKQFCVHATFIIFVIVYNAQQLAYWVAFLELIRDKKKSLHFHCQTGKYWLVQIKGVIHQLFLFCSFFESTYFKQTIKTKQSKKINNLAVNRLRTRHFARQFFSFDLEKGFDRIVGIIRLFVRMNIDISSEESHCAMCVLHSIQFNGMEISCVVEKKWNEKKRKEMNMSNRCDKFNNLTT